jgi:hypothetical protein
VKPRRPNLVSLVSITSGGKPDSKLRALLAVYSWGWTATQPYSWLDLNEHAANDLTQCSRSSLTLEIGANIGQGRGSIGEANKAVRETTMDRSNDVCSHDGEGCPKRMLNLWRSRGSHAVCSTLQLSCVKRKVRRAVLTPSWPPIGARTLWPPALIRASGGVLGGFGAIPAPSVARGAVALSMNAEARRRAVLLGPPPCSTRRGSHALVTSPTVSTSTSS